MLTNNSTTIAGHIDFVQVRNGPVHIRDDKPRQPDESADRSPSKPLRSRTAPLAQAVRHQVRLVQWAQILRVLPPRFLFARSQPLNVTRPAAFAPPLGATSEARPR